MQKYLVKYHVREFDIAGDPVESHTESLAQAIQAHEPEGAARIALGLLRSKYAKQKNMFCKSTSNGWLEVWAMFQDWTGENEVMKVLEIRQLIVTEIDQDLEILFV